MKQMKKFISVLLISAIVLSLLIPTALAAGTVTVTYDTGLTYYQGGVVQLTATPTGISDIVNVAFYDGATLLGNKTSSPYTFHYINLPLGDRSITAQVTDNSSNVITSAAVHISVIELLPSKTTIAGTDLTGYTGGTATIENTSISYVTSSTAIATTQAPNWLGNNCLGLALLPGSTAPRLSFTNMLSVFNTEKKKAQVSMDMCFTDFADDRQFLKIWGGKDVNGVNSTAGNVSNTPITFSKTGGGTIVYTNNNASGTSTLKNSDNSNYVLSPNKWYNFKFITWIDGVNRKWQFYIDDKNVLGTMVMYNSAPPSGDYNTMYYFRGGGNYIFGSANTTNQTTTYYDNLYAYQYQDTPTITPSIITPTSGSVITAGNTVTLTATAAVSDAASIQNVQYYQNGQLIGESATSPYTINAALPAGRYNIIARAVSSTGYSGYSEPTTLDIVLPQYTVTVDSGAGGTVTANPANATVEQGQTVTFTITPDANYEIYRVTFDNNVVTTSNGSYTTPPLTANTVLKVLFREKVKVAPAVSIVDPVHVGSTTFNGTSALSGKTVNGLVINSSFLCYATISNPDGYTIASYGMYLKDTTTGKVIELPVLYKTSAGQFAVQVFGDGFVAGRNYTLQSYVNYIDDHNITKLVLGETEKLFKWQL